MTPQLIPDWAIEKANCKDFPIYRVEKDGVVMCDPATGGYGEGKSFERLICDPNFWECLRRAMGWTDWIRYSDGSREPDPDSWKSNAHRLYDLILTKNHEGIAAFWEALRDKK